MVCERDCEHESERADMRECREDEGVGAAGTISAGKVGGSPEKYCDHAVDGGRELGEREHAQRA